VEEVKHPSLPMICLLESPHSRVLYWLCPSQSPLDALAPYWLPFYQVLPSIILLSFATAFPAPLLLPSHHLLRSPHAHSPRYCPPTA